MSDGAVTFLKDGAITLEGGVDGGRSPSILPRNKVAKATNTTFRGGFASPRPGMKRVPLQFPNDLGIIQEIFTNKRFQHGAFYDGNGKPSLMCSIGGRQFKIDCDTFHVSEITPQHVINVQLITPTTAGFTILSNGSANVSVGSTALFLSTATVVYIGGYAFKLNAIVDGTTINITSDRYNTPPQNITIPLGADVLYTAITTQVEVDANSDAKRIGWSVQAENYWIYQDNQSYAVIFDGATSRRANPALREVPVGNVMAYTMARLTVALTDSQSFRVGDLLFSPESGSADLGYVDSILHFTENDFLNEGGDFVARVFGAPSGYGPILAMKAIGQTDTNLGQGPLMVFTPNVVFTINLPFDRTIWKNLSSALQTVNPIKGSISQNATVSINSDIWYRSLDGIRSYVFAQRQYNQWGNTPMSTEVGEILDFDTPSLTPFASGVLFDNRLLMTTSPVPSPHGIWHRGLVALDFDLLSSLGGGNTMPAWEGSWSGVKFLQLVTGTVDFQERCWAFVLNDTTGIELWEITADEKFDNKNGRIGWTLEFPSYNCGDSFRFKRLELGELFVDNMVGEVTGNVLYKPDQYPCFLPWDSFDECAKNQDCGPDQCSGPQTFREQFRSKIRLHQPPDVFDDQNHRRSRTGYEFQPRLELNGYCRLKQLRILCKDEDEQFFAERRP